VQRELEIVMGSSRRPAGPVAAWTAPVGRVLGLSEAAGGSSQSGSAAATRAAPAGRVHGLLEAVGGSTQSGSVAAPAGRVE